MTSIELINRIDFILENLAPMEMWKLAYTWSRFYVSQRAAILQILVDHDAGSQPHAGARAALAKFVTDLKAPSFRQLSTEAASAEMLVAQFVENGISEEMQKLALAEDQAVVAQFISLLEIAIKEQNPKNTATVLEAAVALNAWYRNLRIRLGIVRELLQPHDEPRPDGTSEILVVFDADLSVHDIAEVLNHLDRIYDHLCRLAGVDEPLRPVKIETGSPLWVKLIGWAGGILGTRSLIANYFKLVTVPGQIDTSHKKIELTKSLMGLLQQRKADGHDVELQETKVAAAIDQVIDDVSYLVRQRPRILIDGKLESPAMPEMPAQLVGVNSPAPKQLENRSGS